MGFYQIIKSINMQILYIYTFKFMKIYIYIYIYLNSGNFEIVHEY